MKSMRQEPPGGTSDPDTRAALELLGGVTATPPEPEMKRRVWAALSSNEERRAVIFPGFLRLPMVASAAVVLLIAGTAGAVIARRFIGPVFHRTPVAEPAPTPVPAPPVRRAASHRPAEPPALALAEPPPDVTVPEPAPAARQTRGTRRAAPVERTARPVETTTATPSPRERAEVLDAMIALRRDHDAVRAGQLLDRYLAARPHGALREEALALAIEAADARGDKASVSNWAQTYQADYPSGRFAGFARSHLKTP